MGHRWRLQSPHASGIGFAVDGWQLGSCGSGRRLCLAPPHAARRGAAWHSCITRAALPEDRRVAWSRCAENGMDLQPLSALCCRPLVPSGACRPAGIRQAGCSSSRVSHSDLQCNPPKRHTSPEAPAQALLEGRRWTASLAGAPVQLPRSEEHLQPSRDTNKQYRSTAREPAARPKSPSSGAAEFGPLQPLGCLQATQVDREGRADTPGCVRPLPAGAADCLARRPPAAACAEGRAPCPSSGPGPTWSSWRR